MGRDPRLRRLRVSCHAGYRGEEAPRRFTVGGREVEVADVLDRWLAPDHRGFRVRGDDGEVYVLRHDTHGGRWELTLTRQGAMRTAR